MVPKIYTHCQTNESNIYVDMIFIKSFDFEFESWHLTFAL